MCSQWDLGWSSKVTGLETFCKLNTQTQNLLGLGLGSGLGTELGNENHVWKFKPKGPIKLKQTQSQAVKTQTQKYLGSGLRFALGTYCRITANHVCNFKPKKPVFQKQTQNPQISGFGSWVWIWNRNWKLGLGFAELLSCHQKLKVTYTCEIYFKPKKPANENFVNPKPKTQKILSQTTKEDLLH